MPFWGYILAIRLHRYALDARRRDRTWRFVAWSVAAGALAGLLVVSGVFAALLLWSIGYWPLAIVVSAIYLLPVLEPVLVRHVLAPLGAVRTAFWVAHLGTMKDSDARGLVCAAWAHARRPTPAGEAWIAARRDKRLPLGDAEIAVTALLAAARGDDATARQLLRSLDQIVEVHPMVRELAGEWLACDAAERGAWAELAADAAAARWPATSLGYFLEGVALRRVGGAGAPGGLELRVRWLLAPFRRATRALLDDPPAPVRAAPDPAPAEPVAPPDRPALPRALSAHLRLVDIVPSTAELADAVAAWDVALADGATRTWLARRALELDAPLGAVDRALRDVAAVVTDELARLADGAQLAAPPAAGPIGDALARRLRHGRLDALEAGFTRWAQRRRDGQIRVPIDEWREWVALRAAYDAAASAGGLELRRLAFPHAYSTGTNMAAWLWNTRREYALSHAISKWLLDEAMVVGDTEAIDLCTRNVRLTVPTRLGNIRASQSA